jgi:glutaredoxin
MKRRKSGAQLGVENVELVRTWIAERNMHRDWHEYAYNNRINRKALAQELDFARSVCVQNHAVKTLLAEAEGYWFQKQDEDKKSHEAARERAEKNASIQNSSNSALTSRVAELEAENRALNKRLKAFETQQAMIEGGSPGFKI